MKWLKRKLRNWVNNSDNEVELQSDYNISKGARLATARAGSELDGDPIRFNVYRANGGTVVQTQTYDRQRDRSHHQLHIIGRDQDIGESLGKIITMESLRG
jgi:hypothetical protein